MHSRAASALRFLRRSAATVGVASACLLPLHAASCAAPAAPSPPTAPPPKRVPFATEARLDNYDAVVAAAVARASSKAQYTGDIRADMEALVLRVQDEICDALAALDGGASFATDMWTREGGGGGRSRALQNGAVFEKAGVNVSIVQGQLPRAATVAMLERKRDAFEGAPGPFPFYAVGVSLVIHPWNPKAPTSHANYRMFQVTGKDPATGADVPMWWFGGGADLTPSYLYEEDARHFHGTLKAACDAFAPEAYPAYKAWCDEYFLIKHRGETRGVGGIFYDDLDTTSWPGKTLPLALPPKQPAAAATGANASSGSSSSTSSSKLASGDPYSLFPFVVKAAESFLPAYLPLVARRKDEPFTPEQKRWQQLRRGRYVEFNLVYDRGTKFGLVTPGSRTESILMSLPLTARWEYCAPEPAPGSEEAKLLAVLRKPVEWVPTTKAD